jgi:hypothetical protein
MTMSYFLNPVIVYMLGSRGECNGCNNMVRLAHLGVPPAFHVIVCGSVGIRVLVTQVGSPSKQIFEQCGKTPHALPW